jgi:hypothetical protein
MGSPIPLEVFLLAFSLSLAGRKLACVEQTLRLWLRLPAVLILAFRMRSLLPGFLMGGAIPLELFVLACGTLAGCLMLLLLSGLL